MMGEMISYLAFFVAGIFIGLVMGRMAHGRWFWEAEMKKMSSKTFREWAELSLKNYRQRKEREEAEG